VGVPSPLSDCRGRRPNVVRSARRKAWLMSRTGCVHVARHLILEARVISYLDFAKIVKIRIWSILRTKCFF
jgi:hypothetical protein